MQPLKLLTVAALGGICAGQLHEPATGGRAIVAPSVLQWKSFLPGAEIAVLQGDLNKEGMFTIRIRMTAGTTIPPHSHPQDESITVLKGSFGLGIGSKFDAHAIRNMAPGAFILIPKSVPHFAVSRTYAIVQIHGTGPFINNFIENH